MAWDCIQDGGLGIGPSQLWAKNAVKEIAPSLYAHAASHNQINDSDQFLKFEQSRIFRAIDDYIDKHITDEIAHKLVVDEAKRRNDREDKQKRQEARNKVIIPYITDTSFRTRVSQELKNHQNGALKKKLEDIVRQNITKKHDFNLISNAVNSVLDGDPEYRDLFDKIENLATSPNLDATRADNMVEFVGKQIAEKLDSKTITGGSGGQGTVAGGSATQSGGSSGGTQNDGMSQEETLKKQVLDMYLATSQSQINLLSSRFPNKDPEKIKSIYMKMVNDTVSDIVNTISENIKNGTITDMDSYQRVLNNYIDKHKATFDNELNNKIQQLPDINNGGSSGQGTVTGGSGNATQSGGQGTGGSGNATQSGGSGGQGTVTGGSTNDTDKIKDMYDKLQYKGMSWPREKLAKILKWAHKKAYEYNKKIHEKGDKAAWYQKALQFLTRIIEFCTRKLHNFVSNKDNQITWEYDKKNDEKDKKPTNESFKWNTNRIIFCEDKLTSKERTDFGLPRERKYPMPDKAHVLAAIRMFNHVDPYSEKELATNIKKKMKQYGISPDQVGEKNRLKKYL